VYTTINRRKSNRERLQETRERGEQEFFPKVQSAPGFIGFYLVTDEEEGIDTAISVWESKAHLEAFAPQAKSWGQALDELGHVRQTHNEGETVVRLEPQT
jgi:heme-degrading monooxygenase HmoA